nr:TonB-dependent receptor [Xanthomonadales bacterium]
LSSRDVRDPRINPTGTPGWATLNLSANWEARPGLSVGLRLRNLLDRAYREHGSGLDARGRDLVLSISAGW